MGTAVLSVWIAMHVGLLPRLPHKDVLFRLALRSIKIFLLDVPVAAYQQVG